MFKEYCDFQHESIINFLGDIDSDYYGIKRILKIYLYVKNDIYYDDTSKNQKASETLVFGYGDNFCKNVLLYTLLSSDGFDCDINMDVVKDNTNVLINRNNKVFPWFYVKINFLGNILAFDPTFDKNYINAAKILDRNDTGKYNINNYYIRGKSLFNNDLNIQTRNQKQKFIKDNNEFIYNLIKSGEPKCI